MASACVPGPSFEPHQRTEAHATRAVLYGSEAELATDSSLIVVGNVEGRAVARDIDGVLDFSLSTIRISEVLKGGDELSAGATVVVRQHGSDEQPPPAPLLEADGTYLLYLTPSGLDGDLANHFYITGASAGIYESMADRSARLGSLEADESFRRLDPDSGDILPDVIDGVEHVSE